MNTLNRNCIEIISVHLPVADVIAWGLVTKHMAEMLLGEQAEPMWQRRCGNITLTEDSYKLMCIRRLAPLPCNISIFSEEASTQKKVFSRKRWRYVLLCGAPGAGCTTVIEKLKTGDVPEDLSRGTRARTIDYKRGEFHFLDVPLEQLLRSDKVRVSGFSLIAFDADWLNGVVHFLVWVVDASNKETIQHSKDTLHVLLNDMPDISLLCYANKMDVPVVMNVAEIVDHLGLHSLRNRKWYIQSSCAISGDGLYEGIDWMEAASN